MKESEIKIESKKKQKGRSRKITTHHVIDLSSMARELADNPLGLHV